MAAHLLNLPNPDATHLLGFRLGQELPAGTTVLLSGDLGSGKTSLVQAIGQGLGIQDPIVSPTFTLINEYHEGRLPLYHLDLYRLQAPEVEDLYLEHYWDGCETPAGIVAIEWPERLPYRPSAYLDIHLKYADSGRQAALTAQGSIIIPSTCLQL